MNHTKTDVFCAATPGIFKRVSKIFFGGLCILFLQHVLIGMGKKDDSDVVKLRLYVELKCRAPDSGRI